MRGWHPRQRSLSRALTKPPMARLQKTAPGSQASMRDYGCRKMYRDWAQNDWSGVQAWQESALARISIVDFNGHRLHDTFGLPKKSVMDYRTHISWINPQWLQAARALAVVQVDITKLLDGRILVGYAIALYWAEAAVRSRLYLGAGFGYGNFFSWVASIKSCSPINGAILIYSIFTHLLIKIYIVLLLRFCLGSAADHRPHTPSPTLIRWRPRCDGSSRAERSNFEVTL